MSELLSFYQQQALQCRSEHSNLASIQEQGLEAWLKLGLPTRQDEAWKYSVPTEFAKHRFKILTTPMPASLNAPGCFWLPLEQALATYPELVTPHLTQLNLREHGFEALNTALLRSCEVIYLTGSAPDQQPLKIQHQSTTPNTLQSTRYLVIVAQDASWSVVESFASSHEQPYATLHLTQIMLGARSQLTYTQIQHEGSAGLHWSHTRVHQDAGSRLTSHSLHLGGQWVRADHTVELQGAQAQCHLNGIYSLRAKQHVDHHTAILHHVGSCDSEQNYKGLLDGESCGVFNGKVWVAPQAQKTQARQYNKNLLLSPQAQINAKPQLEIYANDVVCAHGATVGQLDQEALFYLASRGIEPILAQQFLKEAFTAENFACIQDAALQAQLRELFLAQQQGAYDVARS